MPERSEISVLFMGEITIDPLTMNPIKDVYENSALATDKMDIINYVNKYSPKIIVTTYRYQMLEYHDIIIAIKAHNPDIKIIMLIKEKDCSNMRKILSMGCCSYVYLGSSQEKNYERLLNALKDARQALNSAKNEEYYNALLEDSIVSKSDKQGNITYINDNFTKVTGYTREECYGKNHNILKHPANGSKIYEDMWNTIQTGKIWRERVLNRNKDGTDFWAETTIIPYRDKKTEEISEYVAIRRDITQMLQLKRKIMHQEIEAKEQQKIAEAKDSFLVLFTHELKTPLNAIINFSKYLLNHINKETINSVPLPKRKHLLEQILNSATTMLGDVTNILEISRIRSHKLNYIYTIFNFKKLIREVILAHSALSEENGVEITFDCNGEPFITSDRKRVEQALANILSNAIKYSFGKVAIELVSDKQNVQVIIEDNGEGVEDKESIFELFEQSGKGLLKKEQKGTGIGLNFVKLICKDLQFEYKLEKSQKLGGLKFILSKQIQG